jgi:rod shape-determining protein MreD|nr:rod shape-determining protein MreD [Treponema sp.]
MARAYLSSILIILCTVLVEFAILSNITILPAVPDIVLLVLLYFSVLNGKVFGESMGFFSGMFIDFLSGAPFGFNCLFRTVIGYIAGFLNQNINYTGFIIPALIGLLGTLTKAFLIWITSLFYTKIIPYDIISTSFIFELIINTLLSPVIFKFLSHFNKIICVSKEEII